MDLVLRGMRGDESGVSIESDTFESEELFADLEVKCENKGKEWAEHKKMQGQEMLVLADTIKVLNDDNA